MASLHENSKVRFHPLVEPQFERMNSINPPSVFHLKAPVLWNEDVYALGRDSKEKGKLFKYSLTKNEWSEFPVPSSIYASNSILTTYCSRLLLISGKDMTIWEFTSSNRPAFKASSIKPIPRTLRRSDFDDFIAISKDECLIVCMKRRRFYPGFIQMIYNGMNWKFTEYESIEKFRFHSAYHHEVLIDTHDIIIVAFSDWGNVLRVLKAPMSWSNDVDVSPIEWEELAVASFAKFNAKVCRRQCSIILHSQQLYFTDAQGTIFTSFIQPPILPVAWSKSGINFQHIPSLMGLPNGAMLMIGMIEHQHGSQLDIIKFDQNLIDHKYNPESHLKMKALTTLEWGMNIPVLTKLQSNLNEIKKQVKLKDTSSKPFREIRKPHWLDGHCGEEFRKLYTTGSTSSEVIELIERWIKNVPKPTWRNFLKILERSSSELGQLAYQIKDLFHATEAIDDAAKLKSDLVHLWGSSKHAKAMVKELGSSIALCENILQKMQKANEGREQLQMQLQAQAKELTELKEQLKLYKQAEEDNKVRSLNNKDLPSLLRQLKNHAAKWREIGIHLGFLPGELDNIGARPNLSQGAPVSWFGAMLESWLQWAPEDGRGSTSFATLKDLKDALNETGLGASAHDLHLQGIQTTSSIQLKPEANGTPENCTSEEIVDSNKPLQVPCSDDQQDFTDTPSSSDTRLSSQEKKETHGQCLIQ